MTTDPLPPPPPASPAAPSPDRRALARLRRQLADLRQERDGLLERCRIAEAAAAANLGYAQAARTAMEELAARIEAKLDNFSANIKGG